MLKLLTVRTRSQFVLAGLALLSAPVPALACEPIVPFIKAIGGPDVLAGSLAVLGAVVLFKSAAFARLQKKLSFSKALLWMLAANLLTSIVGVMAPAMIASGALFFAVPIVWGLCLLPARRFIAAAPLSPLARYTPGALAFAMTVALIVSYLLFDVSRSVQYSDSFAAYWIFKIPAIYIALIIGIALTTFLEEWVVWLLSRSAENDLTFVQPVLRANLIVLLSVMLISAAVMIPQRLTNPGFIASEKPKVALEQSEPPLPEDPTRQ